MPIQAVMEMFSLPQKSSSSFVPQQNSFNNNNNNVFLQNTNTISSANQANTNQQQSTYKPANQGNSYTIQQSNPVNPFQNTNAVNANMRPISGRVVESTRNTPSSSFTVSSNLVQDSAFAAPNKRHPSPPPQPPSATPTYATAIVQDAAFKAPAISPSPLPPPTTGSSGTAATTTTTSVPTVPIGKGQSKVTLMELMKALGMRDDAGILTNEVSEEQPLPEHGQHHAEEDTPYSATAPKVKEESRTTTFLVSGTERPAGALSDPEALTATTINFGRKVEAAVNPTNRIPVVPTVERETESQRLTIAETPCPCLTVSTRQVTTTTTTATTTTTTTETRTVPTFEYYEPDPETDGEEEDEYYYDTTTLVPLQTDDLPTRTVPVQVVTFSPVWKIKTTTEEPVTAAVEDYDESDGNATRTPKAFGGFTYNSSHVDIELLDIR